MENNLNELILYENMRNEFYNVIYNVIQNKKTITINHRSLIEKFCNKYGSIWFLNFDEFNKKVLQSLNS